MANTRFDVIARALDVLDRYGLADLSMRRLGDELGVRPSALYHHFPNKQSLLAAVADALLERHFRAPEGGSWSDRVERTCLNLRDSILAYRDGAELVATAYAFGLGGEQPYDALVGALAEGGVDAEMQRVSAGTLLHYIYGFAINEQTQIQASSAGAIDRPMPSGAEFRLGLDLILSGVRERAGQSR